MLKKAFYQLGAELFAQGAAFTPEPLDVMLVSYPKSGNTWIRALVAHLVGVSKTLNEMDHLVPDIYASKGRVLRNAYRFPCSGRLIKSHESFRANYKRVIHLVRDPRDVCISYYHYLANIRCAFDRKMTSVDEFVDLFVSGRLDDYGTWGEHTNSWLAAESAELLLLRYEDLLTRTEDSLIQVCNFLGLDDDISSVSASIGNCSIEKLRAKEERERTQWHPVRRAKKAANFFRQGGSAGRTELGDELLEQICSKWRNPMRKMNYLC